MRLRVPVLLVVSATLALAGCGSSGGSLSSSSGSGGASGPILVFAAASLKEAFTTLGTQFERANPGSKVTFDFGASSTLATQITQSAPADVFAAASSQTMDTVVQAGDAVDPTTFAVNTMEIATPPKATVPVTSLADLGKAGVTVVVCQKDVPCGVAAATLFTKNKVTVTPVSEEVDVKSVLTKVELGEADAGIVYVTDVKAAGDKVVGVEIPSDQNVTTDYPIAAITGSSQSATAKAFVAYVLSPAGQSVLSAAGFAAP